MNVNAIKSAALSLVPQSELVNDMHSKLNPTKIKSRLTPRNSSDLVAAIKYANSLGESLSISGGRHAMGGQQFLRNGLLVDMTRMNKVLHFDSQNGLVEVEAGIFWPDLIEYLKQHNPPVGRNWVISQKQTGGDRLSIGGALASNVHGRGLSLPPIVGDVEGFTIVMHDGRIEKCSRTENAELFKLAIGGYGLFGVVSSVTLRLVPRKVLTRTVDMVAAAQVVSRLEAHAKKGTEYGDFQFSIDHNSPDFLTTGIMSTYAPAETDSIATQNKLLSNKDWQDLLYLAHTDKSAAFHQYAQHYLKTNGQLYWSDTFQLATYLDDYHTELDKRLPGSCVGTEMITELYVPRASLSAFLSDAAALLKDQNANLIYGTVRLIEKDNETFMPWAKDSWACIIFNLHVEHTPHAIAAAGRTFRDLIQLSIKFAGSYYLTYHRFASAEQVLTCYPEMPELLKQKAHYDPQLRFRSDWFDHHSRILGL